MEKHTGISRGLNNVFGDAKWSFVFIAIVTTTFGFMEGLLEILGPLIQGVLQISKAKTGALSACFHAPYIFVPILSTKYLIRKFGYRKNLVAGLVMTCVGCICMVVSARYVSFIGFCLGTFVLGTAGATIDLSTSPYIIICGPQKHSAARLTCNYGLLSTAIVAGLFLASSVVMRPENTNVAHGSLMPVVWAYIAFGILVLLLTVAGCFWPMKEISDDELQERAELSGMVESSYPKPWTKETLFWLGLSASFFFFGSQAGVGQLMIFFIVDVKPDFSEVSAARVKAIISAIFALARFCNIFLMKFVKPRKILLAGTTLCLIFISLSMVFNGYAAIAMIALDYVAKASLQPIIFDTTLLGLGRRTKLCSALLVTSTLSGGLFVPATGAAADRFGSHYSYFVPLISLAMVLFFATYINFFGHETIDAIVDMANCEIRPAGGLQDVERGSVHGEKHLPATDEPTTPSDVTTIEVATECKQRPQVVAHEASGNE